MRAILGFGVLALLTACSSDIDVFGEGGSGTGGDGGAPSTTTSTATGTTQTGSTSSVSTSVSTSSVSVSTGSTSVSTSTGMGCMSGPNDDADQDGWTPAQGDCNDCDFAIGPRAFEIVGNNIDDNCDNVVDVAAASCDQSAAIDDANPAVALQVIGLCKFATGPTEQGVSSAAWVQADGAAPPMADAAQTAAFHLGHGLLPNFGPNNLPREGARLLAISTGTARDATDPGYGDPTGGGKNYTGPHAPGMPKETMACPGITTGDCNDSIALQIAINVPSNATGFAYDSNFFSVDFPAYVCTNFNDTFFASLSPPPLGAPDGQIAIYANGDPISLNAARFDVCSCNGGPCMGGGQNYACSQGSMGLAGTGFENHGATGWQTTTAPVVPGSQIVVRLGVFDAADGIMTSTTLLDHFRWLSDANVVVATAP